MGKVELKLEFDADLLEQARAAQLELSLMLERVVKQALGGDAAEERARRWAIENAEAINSHNRFVNEHGEFGANWRAW
jgi:antitoxin CcdA